MRRSALLSVLVSLLCLGRPVVGFRQPLLHRRLPFCRLAATRTVVETKSNNPQLRQEEEPFDEVNVGSLNGSSNSPRLRKAQRLLAELSQNGDLLVLDRELSTTTQTPALKSSPSSASSAKKGTSNNAIVVPDNFWRNGHLQEQDDPQGGKFVTRWKSGVKVAEPLIQYDPVAAERLLFRQPTKWLVRNFQIAWPLGGWALGVALDYLRGATESDAARSRRRRARAIQLTSAISNLGPAIIKAGQALSSRPDLLPAEYLEELQKLQDDVPRFSNQIAFATVARELQVDSFTDVFALIEEEPVAAASIGQVYKARLLANDDVVALKIQRPNCEAVVALDLYILRWWAGWYNKIFQFLKRDVDVQSIIDDFGVLIYREIDYLAEAANAQRFNELYAGVTDVFVPKIYTDFSTSKVLTMEWVDGVRLTDQAGLEKYNLQASKLVNTLIECSLLQILENGFFHAGKYAPSLFVKCHDMHEDEICCIVWHQSNMISFPTDPHAGNLLAQPDGRLCYLDFGMMSYADTKQRNGFLLAVIHVVNRDWGALVRLYQRLGFIPPGTDLQPIEEALELALPDVLNAEISELNIKNIFNKLGNIFYTYPFSLPPFYISIIRCLGVLEGLAIQVDPSARVVSKSYPFVASKVLTDKQEELQIAFQQLVFTKDGRALRWDRLESLLDEAKDSSTYDVTAALSLLTDYFISSEEVDEATDARLADLAQQLVEAADSLGSESVKYVLDASRALAVRDEVGAVKAFRSLQKLQLRDGVDGVRKRLGQDIRGALPKPTPSMERFQSIVSLILGNGSGSTDPAKFVPIVRKMAQDPRVRRTASEVVARLGERVLSRSLRAAFGLPPPQFGTASHASTVTEDSSR